jgi:hypothetical protein
LARVLQNEKEVVPMAAKDTVMLVMDKAGPLPPIFWEMRERTPNALVLVRGPHENEKAFSQRVIRKISRLQAGGGDRLQGVAVSTSPKPNGHGASSRRPILRALGGAILDGSSAFDVVLADDPSLSLEDR